MKNYKEAQKFIQFFTNLGETRASFLTNIAFQKLAPIDTIIYKYCFGVMANDMMENGFPIKTEMDFFYSLEDKLLPQLEKYNIVLVGTTLYDGRREIFFYGDDDVPFEDCVNTLMKEFSDYKYIATKEVDATWEHYFNFLYPSPYEEQSYYTNLVIQNLEKSGDNLEAEREVDYYMFFDSEADANHALNAVMRLGFGATLENNVESFQIHATKISCIIPDIYTITRSLITIALENDGHFDGWGCSIAK